MSTTIIRDRACDVARTAGAIIGFENMQGKGNVIRRMFADVEADIYVTVDGDDTYDALLRRGWFPYFVTTNSTW